MKRIGGENNKYNLLKLLVIVDQTVQLIIQCNHTFDAEVPVQLLHTITNHLSLTKQIIAQNIQTTRLQERFYVRDM